MRHLMGNRIMWLAGGVLIGLAAGWVWPDQTIEATTADRNSKFGMVTAPVSFTDGTEGVFVLDYLTGQLHGAVVNPKVGAFTIRYYRNIAADFNLDPQAQPQYAMVSGRGQLLGQRGVTMGTGLLYVAELSSGQVLCYSFPFQEANRPVPQPLALVPVGNFAFRTPVEPE